MTMKKAPCPDGVLTETLVVAGEYGLEEFTRLTNMLTLLFLEELNKSIFINLPKISGTTKCEKHGTISLISHITQLILRVLLNRVRGRRLQEIAPEQYDFMLDKGTSNAIFVLRRMSEREREREQLRSKSIYIHVPLTIAKHLI